MADRHYGVSRGAAWFSPFQPTIAILIRRPADTLYEGAILKARLIFPDVSVWYSPYFLQTDIRITHCCLPKWFSILKCGIQTVSRPLNAKVQTNNQFTTQRTRRERFACRYWYVAKVRSLQYLTSSMPQGRTSGGTKMRASGGCPFTLSRPL